MAVVDIESERLGELITEPISIISIRKEMETAIDGCGGNIQTLRCSFQKISEHIETLRLSGGVLQKDAENLDVFLSGLRAIIGH
ncbi:MAG TPA: hypothetical protein VFI61_04045 [Patescibacteria group bacterium]|nr:hypothetical protein [Patescibacteria group bacterium]